MKLRSGTITNRFTVAKTNFDDISLRLLLKLLQNLSYAKDINNDVFPHLIQPQTQMYKLCILHRAMDDILVNHLILHQMVQKYPSWKTVVSMVAKKGHELVAQMNDNSASNTKWTNVQKFQFCDFAQTMNEIQVKFPLID